MNDVTKDDLFSVIDPQLNSDNKHTEYYLNYIYKLQSKKLFLSWNWASFIFGTAWFFYRKMYFIGLIIFCFYWSILAFVAIKLSNQTPSLTLNDVYIILGIALFIRLIIVPLISNWLYGFHIRFFGKFKYNIFKGKNLYIALILYLLVLSGTIFAFIKVEELKQGITNFQHLLEKTASDHLTKAFQLAYQHKFNEALQQINLSISKDPIADAYALKAHILFEMRDMDGAKEAADKAISLEEKNLRANLVKSSILQFEGNCNEAFANLEKVLKEDPSNINAHKIRGACYLETAAFDKALADFDYILVQPDTQRNIELLVFTKYSKATALYLMREYSKSEDILNEIISMNIPFNLKIGSLRGLFTIYKQQNRIDEAPKIIDRLILEAPIQEEDKIREEAEKILNEVKSRN